jgi:diguanylate cyclase (GGDEF)-like protein
MGVLGAVGWGALVHAGTPILAPILPYVLFLLVIVATRSMAFRLRAGPLVALDSAFYIAAVGCLGPLGAGWMVAAALAIDGLLRPSATSARGPDERLLFAVYFGGMTGGLLMLLGRAIGVELAGRDELAVFWRVGVLGLAFLGGHYLIQGARLAIAGQTARAYLPMALSGMLAEASLLPLAAVVVYVYRPERPLGLVLTGLTYLLVNFVFNRLSHATEDLRKRVAELETLNRTAHTLASTLQLHELTEAIARETLEAVPAAELFMLSHREGEGFVVDWLDREHRRFERLRAREDEGVSAWVVKHRRPLRLADLGRSELAVKNDPGVCSWLGVPILVYDEVIGVLSVQSRERGAFGAAEERVLQAIGAQAAVALQNARLYELATVDGLTGLYVRRYFDGRLREELERSRRFEVPFSVVLLDIDDFKQLNDCHGHALGDRVLRDVARAMRRCLRGVDIAARYGGEEFAAILPRTAMLDAHAVAERIRRDIGEVRVVHDGRVVGVSASLGVACFPESSDGEAGRLVELADVALYRAKAAGKNRVELYWREAHVPQARSP